MKNDAKVTDPRYYAPLVSTIGHVLKWHLMHSLYVVVVCKANGVHPRIYLFLYCGMEFVTYRWASWLLFGFLHVLMFYAPPVLPYLQSSYLQMMRF